jgi:hypothetical protein
VFPLDVADAPVADRLLVDDGGEVPGVRPGSDEEASDEVDAGRNGFQLDVAQLVAQVSGYRCGCLEGTGVVLTPVAPSSRGRCCTLASSG